jgi:aromatic ring-opening dioxygenase catalytic subunit (LigB family)
MGSSGAERERGAIRAGQAPRRATARNTPFHSPGFLRPPIAPTLIPMTEPTRRDVLAAGVGVAALAACEPRGATEGEEAKTSSSGRMPVVYLPHGGGPWPWIEMVDRGEHASMSAYLDGLRALPPRAPRAVLVISAHWEAAVPTVMTSARPPMLFDYYGFPEHTYQLSWPAPGEPALAARVQALLAAAGIASATDSARGFDHGTFVPLKLVYPDADVPTVQLSLQAGLDPARHLAIGRALAPLRDEGVFIVGSGSSYHNLRKFGDARARVDAGAFDGWLGKAATAEPAARDAALTAWTEAPSARAAHPREEHLIPLMVIAGAAGADRGTVAWQGTFAGMAMSAIHYG